MVDSRSDMILAAQEYLAMLIGPDLASQLWVTVADATGPDGGTVEAHLQVSGPDIVWAEAYPLLQRQVLMAEPFHFWPDSETHS